jgi:molecular chaperone GrpE
MNEKVYKEAEEAEEKAEGVKKAKKPRAKKPKAKKVEVVDDASAADVTLQEAELEELRAKLEAKDKESVENKELYLRSRADLENYKVRAAKERAELMRHANDKIIGEFLSILDNMERALEHSETSNDVESLAKGVQLIHDNMISQLATMGLKPVEAVGAQFDPNVHEAISHEEDANNKPGTVIREFKKGYFLNDRLLRPATVSVAKELETIEPVGDSEEAE